MMRKGDLAEYSPEWVLRTAAQEHVEGGIEFDVGRRISVYLNSGRIYLVLADGDPEEVAIDEDLDDHAFAAAVEATEHRLLPHALDLLVELVGATSGEYFHHPLNEHPLNGEWEWDTADMVDEANRRRRAADEAAAAAAQAEAAQAEAERREAEGDGSEGDGSEVPETDAEVGAGATAESVDDAVPDTEGGDGGAPADSSDDAASEPTETDGPAWGADSMVRLTGAVPEGEVGADGWALIAAMADAIPVSILSGRLGWTPERVAEVLEDLRTQGAVSEESFGIPAFTPPASAAG